MIEATFPSGAGKCTPLRYNTGKAQRLDDRGITMKTRILSKLTLEVLFDDGRKVECPLSPKLGRFVFDRTKIYLKHDVDNLLRVLGVTAEGNVVVSYVFDGDYDPKRMAFAIGESLAIEDHIDVFVPEFEPRLQHVRLTLRSEAKEVELGELVLSVHESASAGPDFISGDIDEEVPARVGTRIEPHLLRNGTQNIEVTGVDGPNVTLSVDGKPVRLTPNNLFHEYRQQGGGYPDVDSSERFLDIALRVPGAIQIPDRT